MAAECKLPLPKPIRLGPVEIHTRDFVVLRLVAENGLYGDALGYPRGTSLLDSIKRMAPHVLGTSIGMRRATIDGFLQNYVNGRPTFIKAASLFDISLWDLAAKQHDQPLFKLMGGVRERVPVMVVAGYYLDQRSISNVCEEIRMRVDDGFERIKIMILGTDPDYDEKLVSAASEIAGRRLCVDAHWAWRTIEAANKTCRLLEKFDLGFIEDPFGPYQGHLTGKLQKWLKTPLAYGEDLPDAQSLNTAINQVPILRLDSTTCGGISTAMSVADQAGIVGTAVLPHVFLPVHAQLAGSLNAIDAVEYIPIESGACPMFELLEGVPKIENGVLEIDQRPGSGFHLNWDKVMSTVEGVYELSI